MPASRSTSPAPRPRDPRAGFALLLTITLLAFVVVLLIGLATYTRVETAIAGNTQRQAQARQNALLGLNVALGQLQKYAGPDQRVTATAENFGGINGTRYYTGVWDSTGTDATPLTWLVSGNEVPAPDGTPNPLKVQPSAPGSSTVQLVGPQTVGTGAATNNIVAPLQTIATTGVPGVSPASPAATIGRYAWWVGDQGVKAPVAVGDPTALASNFNYDPYRSPETLSRLRQQISLGAGALNSALTAPQIEPRDANNAALVANGKVFAASQLAFLKTASSTGAAAPTTAAAIGLTAVQQNFHVWSPNNFNVLANTKTGGLRQDLSLDPTLLGDAFAAWANYPVYLEPTQVAAVTPAEGGTPGETPATSSTPSIQPAYGTDPLRRRYRLTAPAASAGAVHSVAPVLSFFGLSFSVRESASAAPLMEVAARCVIGLWNPYSSALVPEDLRIEVTRLPKIDVVDSANGSHQVDLQDVMSSGGGPMRFSLPWVNNGSEPDHASWLPGRVYDWAAPENLSAPAEGIPMVFHSPDATPTGAGQGIVRQTTIQHNVPPPEDTTPVTRSCEVAVTTTLHIRLLRASDDMELAAFDSVVFPPFVTTPLPVANKYVDFAFVCRLPEKDEVPTGAAEKWLSAAGRDPREQVFPSVGFISGVKGEDPGAYGGPNIVQFAVRDANRLLDRGGGQYSYNEDAPVFELPRAPLLSLGALQHLHLLGARPFSIGNSWGAANQVNGVAAGEFFDRYFFSGLATGVDPTVVNGALMLPNPSLKVLRDSTTHAAVASASLRVAPDSRSSKFLLSGGAFNLNSISTAAWAAVLRGVRFPAPQSFTYLDVDAATGTADDASVSTVQSGDAQFFRFSQSAQETYKAEAGNSGGAAATELFRKGMITLTTARVAALAKNIADAVKAHNAASGPFRTLEEFLSPAAAGGKSLLEQAIADAGINSAVTEFSSQWLTQADIMTALAPVLFPRSDTFVIRSYGEAVNPATTATEGRAWCEAIVQRVPEYLDKADAEEIATADLNSLNTTFGRRFKVVSFRWLTRSDI